MRPIILVCIAVFTIAMLLVKFTAVQIAANFGAVGIWSAVAVLLLAAYLHDRRQRQRR